MPVQIGEKPHSFADPTGLLSDCHRRIEMFMRAFEAVAQVIDSPPNEETSRSLETALRYFQDAAPKHTADEEESLFPRLRQLQSPEVHSAFSKLDELEHEHRWAEPLHATVDKLGWEYLSKGYISPGQVEAFRAAVSELSSMYRRHIAVEDEKVFPVATRVLSAEAKRAVAEEMARRRKPPLV